MQDALNLKCEHPRHWRKDTLESSAVKLETGQDRSTECTNTEKAPTPINVPLSIGIAVVIPNGCHPCHPAQERDVLAKAGLRRPFCVGSQVIWLDGEPSESVLHQKIRVCIRELLRRSRGSIQENHR